MEFMTKLFMYESLNGLTQDIHDPLKVIFTQLKLLNEIISTPFPHSLEDKNDLKTYISNSLLKIILCLDVILTDKVISSDGLKSENYHYWNILLRHFGNKKSVKFIQYYLLECRNIQDKGLAWLCIDILDKNLHCFFKEFFMKKISLPDSLIIRKRKELLDFSEKLENLSLDIGLSNLYSEFKEFKNLKEPKFTNENDIEIPKIEKVKKAEIIEINSSPVIYNKDTQFLPSNTNCISGIKIDNKNDFSSNTIISLNLNYKISSKPQEDLLFTSNSNIGELKELFENKLGQSVVIRRKSSKTQGKVKKSKFFRNKEEYKILKYSDMNFCLMENYYDFKRMFENFEFQDEKTLDPFEQKFKVAKKNCKAKYTTKDIVYYNNKVVSMKNSVLFYLNHFYKKMDYYKFNISIPKTLHSLESQNNQCHLCLKKFNKILFWSTSKVYWCSYFLHYVCGDCITNEFSIIPAFILKNWNFKKFSISKNALQIINSWYSIPTIHIKLNDYLLVISFRLRQAIILKRKIHKIFDMMKCESAEEFALNSLKEYKYLVLKQNLFSLKDLCKINDFSLIYKLQDFFFIFEHHIQKDCQGGTCFVCANEEVIYSYNIDNIFYCEDCRNIFHKKCSSVHPCFINKN